MNKIEYEAIVTDNNKSNKHNIHHFIQELNQIHNNNNQHMHHQQKHNQNIRYNVNLKFQPQIPNAGKTTTLEINITEQKTSNIIQNFETIHDKLMHLIIIGEEDLSYFEHIHPALGTYRSMFFINHIFPESGNYKIWIDFKPKDGIQTLAAFKFNVYGSPIHKPIPIENKKQFTKPVDEKYQITLKVPKEIKANADVDITFSLANITGNPITDLQPLMGAGGHTIIISSNAQEFLHVHPSQEVARNWRGGPDIQFRANFPLSGLYKVWGQFQHGNKIITVDFILEVE
ncbi:MAG: hypothetical protein ACTHME_07020 [Candidatus Nitrosocosmicus sp.]